LALEVLHMMPDDLTSRYTNRQISEAMAYYRIKHEDAEAAAAAREPNIPRPRPRR